MKQAIDLDRHFLAPLLLGIGGAVGGFAAGVGKAAVEGAISDNSYKKRAQWDYEYGEKQAENAYQRQLEFWNKTNVYNTPSNQRARLEAAGLNPALMYSSGPGSNTAGYLSGSNQAPKAGGSAYNPRISLGEAMDAAMRIAQIRNINADTEKKKVDTIFTNVSTSSEVIRQSLLASQVIGQNLANSLAEFDLSLKRELRANTVELSNQSVIKLRNNNDKLNAEIIALMNENAMFPERLTLLRQQFALNNAQIGALDARAALSRSGINLNEAEVRLIEERIQQIASEISRTTSETANLQSLTALNWQTWERNEPATKGAQKRFDLENARIFQQMGTEVVNSVVNAGTGIYGAYTRGKAIQGARAARSFSASRGIQPNRADWGY